MSKRRTHDAAFRARGVGGVFERDGKAAAAAGISEDTVHDPHARIGDLCD